MNNLENNNGGPSDPSKRSFFGKMLGIATVGAIAAVGGNKYLKQELENKSEINDLFLSLKGKEGDINKVNEAATQLIEEMNNAKVNQVKITGTGHPNERIDILRDFITKHLNSKIGNRNPAKNEIFSSGVYTRDNLAEILSATTVK